MMLQARKASGSVHERTMLLVQSPTRALLLILSALMIIPFNLPAPASVPLCAMEIWTDKREYRSQGQVELWMWIKASGNPEYPPIIDANVTVELKQPFGYFIAISSKNGFSLAKGAELTERLFTLQVEPDRFRNLGQYELRASLSDLQGNLLCESANFFVLQSSFGLQRSLQSGISARPKTLIVTSSRTEFTEPFATKLAVWLDAAYRTETQIIFQEGLSQFYRSGDLRGFDVIIYYGLDFNQPPPIDFLEDLFEDETARTKKIVWLGYHLDKVMAQTSSLYGFEFEQGTSGNVPAALHYVDTRADFTLLNQEIVFAKVTNSALARVRGTWGSEHAKDVIISASHVNLPDRESFYFFGFHPTSSLFPYGGHLVFLDLLNEVYGIQRGKTALVRLEDVHARMDPDALLSVTGFLRSKGIPFTLALIPVYADEFGEHARLSLDLGFRRMVKNALLDGGEIVAHGNTHQYDGRTADDYEFWDEARGQALGDEGYVRQRVIDSLIEISFAGLESQLIGWETPHYAASLDSYEVFEEYFDLIYEDSPWGYDLALVPYVTERSRAVYVPTPLGFIGGERADSDVSSMLAKANTLSGLQYGALASFFYHPTLGLEYLRTIVEYLQAQGWTFRLASTFRPRSQE